MRSSRPLVGLESNVIGFPVFQSGVGYKPLGDMGSVPHFGSEPNVRKPFPREWIQ